MSNMIYLTNVAFSNFFFRIPTWFFVSCVLGIIVTFIKKIIKLFKLISLPSIDEEDPSNSQMKHDVLVVRADLRILLSVFSSSRRSFSYLAILAWSSVELFSVCLFLFLLCPRGLGPGPVFILAGGPDGAGRGAGVELEIGLLEMFGS